MKMEISRARDMNSCSVSVLFLRFFGASSEAVSSSRAGNGNGVHISTVSWFCSAFKSDDNTVGRVGGLGRAVLRCLFGIFAQKIPARFLLRRDENCFPTITRGEREDLCHRGVVIRLSNVKL